MVLDPSNGRTAIALAKIYVQQGMGAKALGLLRSVETLKPGQADVGVAIKALERGLPPP
jgi:hypothetical protein